MKASSPTSYTSSEIWEACAQVLASSGRPVEIRHIASCTDLTEEQVVEALMSETLERREAVTFRYPPLPCAAIMGMGDLTVKRKS